MCEVEVWVMVDAAGDYAASDDPDLLNERYEEKVQEMSEAEGFRRVKITVKVPLPQPLAVSVDVVEEPAEPVAV